MKQVNCNVYTHRDDQSSNGAAIDSSQLVSSSFHIVPGKNDDAGTLKIQASNDEFNGAQNFAPTNWVDIPNATSSISSGAPALITIANLSYRWLRVSYTRSGGGSSTTFMVVNMFAVSV